MRYGRSEGLLRTALDLTFTWLPVTFIFLWLGQTFLSIYNTGNWYGATRLFIFGYIHNLTTLSVCILYIILFAYFDGYRQIPVPMRVVTVVVFISFGIQFNGIVWSILNLFIGSRTGMPQLNLAFFFLICVVLFWLHRTYEVVHIHYRTMLITTGLFFLSLALFLDSGFFYQWNLYEQGLASDPHNWQWGFEQFVGVWMWLGIVRR